MESKIKQRKSTAGFGRFSFSPFDPHNIKLLIYSVTGKQPVEDRTVSVNILYVLLLLFKKRFKKDRQLKYLQIAFKKKNPVSLYLSAKSSIKLQIP